MQPTKSDNGVDRVFGFLAKKLAERTSRKGFLAQAGSLALKVAGVTLLPLLPIDRIVRDAEGICSFGVEPGCGDWQLCGICGNVCCNNSGCNNGSKYRCPTCTSREGMWCLCCDAPDGNSYEIKYYDCCETSGQTNCEGCENCTYCCPRYQPKAWCYGKDYRCTIVVTGSRC